MRKWETPPPPLTPSLPSHQSLFVHCKNLLWCPFMKENFAFDLLPLLLPHPRIDSECHGETCIQLCKSIICTLLLYYIGPLTHWFLWLHIQLSGHSSPLATDLSRPAVKPCLWEFHCNIRIRCKYNLMDRATTPIAINGGCAPQWVIW